MKSSEPPDSFQSYESLDACPVCDSSRIQLAFPPDVIRCEVCRVYAMSPRPSIEEIWRVYNTGLTYRHWAGEREIRQQLWQIRMDKILRHTHPGRILDIGTGDGHFLSLCQDAGFKVDATEISSHGLELCRERGFNPRLGALTDLNWDGRRFDVITLWHVLEHLPNPGKALKLAYELLEPGGLLVVAVPNEETRLFPHRWWPRTKNPMGKLYWGNEVHIIFFQPQTLLSTLRRFGFEVMEFGVDNVETHPNWRTHCQQFGHTILSVLTQWHLYMAMYAIVRKPYESKL